MRVLIDTNSLQTDELKVFLSADRENKAVLPEHTTAEIFKPRDLNTVFASHAILCEYPHQVLVLRANSHAMSIDARTPAISNRFIDRKATREFPEYCRDLREAQRGHPGYLRQIAQRQQWAQERPQAVEDALGDQADSLNELRQNFSPHELSQMSRGDNIPLRSRQVILAMVTSIAEQLARSFPSRASVPPSPYRYNHFGWRSALCDIIQLIRLINDGAQRRAPPRARNDHFDNVFATFGTYFNGVMSNDAGMLATQSIARLILRSLGARMATDYIESGYIVGLMEVAPNPSSDAIPNGGRAGQREK
jgi:hypothetical protein